MEAINTVQRVKGLKIVPQFITKDQEAELLQEINQKPWNTTLKRRTQHYGYQYSYKVKHTLEKAQPIPQIFLPVKKSIQAFLRQHMREEAGTNLTFNQLIINQYEPGQGIAAHIDDKILFSDVIVGLSLGSNTTMNFQIKGQEKQEVRLFRRSLLIMSGQSRYKWTHSIASRKKDNGIVRGTRVSMTWRCCK